MPPSPNKAKLQTRFALVAMVGGALSAGSWFLDPAQFLRSYLVAWLFWLSISLGSLLLLLLHNLTGGAWGWRVRHILVAAASTLPGNGLAFLPIGLNLVHLYSWADETLVVGNPILEHKALYLNQNFFLIRAGVYWIVWLAALILVRASSRHIDPQVMSAGRPMRVASGIALGLCGLTITFASFDLGMSLEPEWFSTIYGVIFFAGQGLAALAFAIVALVHIDSDQSEPTATGSDDLHDLGKLLLAFTMFWAYVSFSQFLIIWYGNLPEEVVWYQHRLADGWQWVEIGIAIFHFIVPFVILLGREIKRKARPLAAVALWLLAMRWLDTVWQIEPAFYNQREGWFAPWPDLAITAAVGGLWLLYFNWLLTPVLVPAQVLTRREEEAILHD